MRSCSKVQAGEVREREVWGDCTFPAWVPRHTHPKWVMQAKAQTNAVHSQNTQGPQAARKLVGVRFPFTPLSGLGLYLFILTQQLLGSCTFHHRTNEFDLHSHKQEALALNNLQLRGVSVRLSVTHHRTPLCLPQVEEKKNLLKYVSS